MLIARDVLVFGTVTCNWVPESKIIPPGGGRKRKGSS